MESAAPCTFQMCYNWCNDCTRSSMKRDPHIDKQMSVCKHCSIEQSINYMKSVRHSNEMCPEMWLSVWFSWEWSPWLLVLMIACIALLSSWVVELDVCIHLRLHNCPKWFTMDLYLYQHPLPRCLNTFKREMHFNHHKCGCPNRVHAVTVSCCRSEQCVQLGWGARREIHLFGAQRIMWAHQ